MLMLWQSVVPCCMELTEAKHQEFLALQSIASQVLRWAGEQEVLRKQYQLDDAPELHPEKEDSEADDGDIVPCFSGVAFSFKGHLPQASGAGCSAQAWPPFARGNA